MSAAKKKRRAEKTEFFIDGEFYKPDHKFCASLPPLGQLMAMPKESLVEEILKVQNTVNLLCKERDNYLSALESRQVIITNIWKYLNAGRYGRG